jgi:hypothetical protein
VDLIVCNAAIDVVPFVLPDLLTNCCLILPRVLQVVWDYCCSKQGTDLHRNANITESPSANLPFELHIQKAECS